VILTSDTDGATPAEIAMLKEHLPYELDMLERAFVFLHDEKYADDRKNDIVKNAMIEAFWVHARNLLEFLTHPEGEGATGVASARDFTDKNFSPPPKKNFESILDDVNDQITHLRYERRTSPPQAKLGGHDMTWVRRAIHSQIKRFEQHLLKQKYAPFWAPRSSSEGGSQLFTNEALNTTTIKGNFSK
jgi:hypothetical protein